MMLLRSFFSRQLGVSFHDSTGVEQVLFLALLRRLVDCLFRVVRRQPLELVVRSNTGLFSNRPGSATGSIALDSDLGCVLASDRLFRGVKLHPFRDKFFRLDFSLFFHPLDYTGDFYLDNPE